MKTKTKSEQLWDIIKRKKYVSSAQINKIGQDIFYQRAMRTAREWASFVDFYNKIKPIPNDVARKRRLVKNGQAPIRWYEVVGY